MLLNSKLIKSITIVNNKQTFEISTGQELADMIKRVAETVLGDTDHYFINEGIMLGLLYDDEIFSDLQIAINHSYFYECREIEEIAKIAKIAEGDIKEYKDLLEDTIKFLKKHSDILQHDGFESYEDLAIAQFGRVAEDLNEKYVSRVRGEIETDQLIAAMKKHFSSEDLKDKEIARRVLRSLAAYCEVEDFSFFITRDNKYNAIIKDKFISDLKVAKFKECIDRVFECETEMMKEYELSEDENIAMFNIMCELDTTLISVTTHI